MDLTALGATFAVVFAAELPDKTMFASLVLSTRYAARWVFVGAAAAFSVQVVLAVAVGQAFSLLPRRAVDAVVAVLFAAGAALLLLGHEDEDTEQADTDRAAGPTTPQKVVLTAFSIVFLAEFGDLTQIATANLAAKYQAPIAVGVGAVLALWAVAAIATAGGRTLVKVVPLVWVRRLAGVLMAILAVVTALDAIRG